MHHGLPLNTPGLHRKRCTVFFGLITHSDATNLVNHKIPYIPLIFQNVIFCPSSLHHSLQLSNTNACMQVDGCSTFLLLPPYQHVQSELVCCSSPTPQAYFALDSDCCRHAYNELCMHQYPPVLWNSHTSSSKQQTACSSRVPASLGTPCRTGQGSQPEISRKCIHLRGIPRELQPTLATLSLRFQRSLASVLL